MNSEVYVVPISNGYEISATNNKLIGCSLRPSLGNGSGQPNWYYVVYAE